MISAGPEELPTLALHCSAPRCVRFFGSVERTKMHLSVVHFRRSGKSRPLTGLPNPTRQVPLWARPIPLVLLMRSLSKIAPAIVKSVSVGMVNLLRPPPGLHHPDDAVGQELVISDIDLPISPSPAGRALASMLRIKCSLIVSLLKVIEWTLLPNQRAGLRSIRETLAQILDSGQPLGHEGVVS